ncbi:MAG: ATP-binding protein [Candidatus Bathyarchaeota archaeon]
MDWNVDFKELIPFLGKTIYRPENVLVELCANSYDADSSLVEITTKGESEQVLIKDNGCGMDMADLKELVTLAKSKKKQMIERNEVTPKYKRKLLGCFGIGIVSFFALGDFIRFFTLKEGNNPIFLEIKKVFDENSKLKDIVISEPIQNNEFRQHLMDSEKCLCGTTIEVNNKGINFIKDYDLIAYKLSNLPLSKDFKIAFNGVEVKKDDLGAPVWLKREFEFTLESIDPSYHSKARIYVNLQKSIESYRRGVYLVVNGRVIEDDLFAELYQDLTSPNTILYRVRGLVNADYLQRSIQANRESFFDTAIINEIKNKIRPELQEIINDYNMQRVTAEKEQGYNELLQRIEKAKNKFTAPNQHLKKLRVNFASNPDYEQEVVLIIAQLCQEGLLPFQILDYNGGSHIDCIVKWPVTQSKRDPSFIAELEVETSLDKFFEHEHDFRTKPDICCWDVKEADFERKKKKYIKDRPESIVSIDLKGATDAEHFKHQKELHFTIKEAHNELKTFILRIYVISEIIEKLGAAGGGVKTSQASLKG